MLFHNADNAFIDSETGANVYRNNNNTNAASFCMQSIAEIYIYLIIERSIGPYSHALESQYKLI